MAARRQLE